MRLVALAVVLAAAPAGADDVVPVRVTASLHGTTAHFAVHATVTTVAATFPAASVELALPQQGLVTGATAIVGGVAHALVLAPVDAASDAFHTLGDAAEPHGAWAVLLASSGGSASIDIAAPEARTVALDLEVEAPTCFERAHRFVEVPARWRDLVATAEPPKACEGHADGAWVAFAVAPPEHIGTIAGRLALQTADIARVELDLSRELDDVPADLHTAIVVDASRSLTAAERAAQRAVIASYLRAVPRTSVQLVGYARTAAPMLGGWTSTETAARPIDRELATLRPANGSNLDAGLAEAGAWLARTTGTRRVLLFTDERVARRLATSDGNEFASWLPDGTLVHVIAVDDAGALSRDDRVKFGALATVTGGIGVRGSRGDATLLARPITLDAVEIAGAGWDPLDIGPGCTSPLAAGTSCTWWAQGDATSGPITITGSLWNRRMTRVVVPDPTRAISLARELSVLGGLDASVQDEVDRAALAVNGVWSMFVRWGGSGGYPEPLGFDTISGTAGGHTSSTIVDTIGVARVVPQVDLHAQLAGPLARCGPVHATIDIELTREEIVDVHVDGATGAARSCLEDAVWATLVTVAGAPDVSRAHIVL